MTKKDFIALADAIRDSNRTAENCGIPEYRFTQLQLNILAAFCEQQNRLFNRSRWLSYIAGECGKNGGKVKAA